ncbi:MAG: DUF6473 family protein [Antarcticimicrobium sp.]|uniref:DUF6473 family protein n=1 Tax=Antarcticimicrobium sp. TaxID=2824147 RepID=UPI00260AAD2C|nr:DUF6473 family protein [Antarcticimicrobium sp.]MDF1718534.1 DUF6473 family protein [Antarcticimicrobium sp.]
MSLHMTGAGALEDPVCHYPGSRLPVRGPCTSLAAPYIAFLGGSETFGRFVAAPFPALADRRLGRSCVNLGSINAGLDVVLGDPGALRIATGAALCVVQLPGAQNLSNRFYRVHPRRNDRFLEATFHLAALYPDVDFTEFHFTNHLLTALYRSSAGRFAPIRDELRRLWVARMQQLMTALGGRALLLWLQYGDGRPRADAPLGAEPLLVSRSMVDQVLAQARGLVEVPVTPAGQLEGETRKMDFGPLQRPAAEHMLGPAMHARIADRVVDVIAGLR